MISRKTNSELKFFVCQTADWQTVVLAEDAFSAAANFIEECMNNSEKVPLAALTLVQKMNEDLNDEPIETKIFFTPMILADAGFHNEAIKLKNFLDEN